ncbi:G-patch domain and KOW motifs-containing protein-like [Anthonomus grandis grandis]|uniref:G-patch domain and KOW motifs-containing protein-like n=1 Tax=Anthonomus grandis grandis TaxID=2921223 RepID=UPI002166BEC9|nr:G-patch domain and KOW motifs-containing protein-like [Anthonomus grandis grandis]
MELSKVSFGFSKITKKTNIISSTLKQEEKKVELVECLEGQNIKVKDAIEEVKGPLVIPLKDNEKSLLDRIKASKKKSTKNEAKQEGPKDTRPDSELTPDELAARLLIKDAQERLANGHITTNSKVSMLPASTDLPDLEGEKEPTLEDYESVPINDFGIALLRGMGWKEGMPIGKNVSKAAPLSVPELRPKGLGLGATKVIQDEMPNKKAKDNDGNELILVKNAFAKVIAGHHKGFYCQVQGFDEEAGRVIIKVYPKGEIVNINELMLIPVTKDEFSKGSKFINNAKYEEYKQISDKKLESFKGKKERTDYNSDNEEDREEKSKKSDRNIKIEVDDSDSDNVTRRRGHRSSQKHNDSSPERGKSSKSNRRSRSKEKKSSRKQRSPSNSSDDDYYRKKKSHKHKKSENRKKYRSRSKSRDKSSKNRKNRANSSDSDHYHEKSKSKKSASKSKHRSRSRETERYTSKRR